MSTTAPLEAALWQAWQGNHQAWQQMRREAVSQDLGQTASNRLLLVLGEEATAGPALTPDQHTLDAYLFRIGQQQLAEGSLTVADGVAPLLVHFANRRARGQQTAQAYDRQLVNQVMPLVKAALDAPTVDLSLYNGLSGVMLSLGRHLDHNAPGDRFWPDEQAVETLLGTYLQALQQWKLPIDAGLQQFNQFPNRLLGRGDIWEEADHCCWATGDLGQALLLANCGRWLGQPDLTRWAVQVATYTLHRRRIGQMPTPATGIRYGKAGLMLLYQRLYALTGVAALTDEASYWQQAISVDLSTLTGAPNPDMTLLDGLPGIQAALQMMTTGGLSLGALLV